MPNSKTRKTQAATPTDVERLLQMTAVQAVLQLNWYNQKHVLQAAQQLLQHNPHDPRTKTRPSERSPSTAWSTSEPFSAATLMQELESQFDKDKENILREENRKTDGSAVEHRADDVFTGEETRGAGACGSDVGSKFTGTVDASACRMDSEKRFRKERKADSSICRNDAADRFGGEGASVSGVSADSTFRGGDKIMDSRGQRSAASDLCRPEVDGSSSKEGASGRRLKDQAEHCEDSFQHGEKQLHPACTGDNDAAEAGRPREIAALDQSEPIMTPKVFASLQQKPPSPQSKNPETSPRPRDEKIAALKRENSRLKARLTCRQCRQRPANLTLLPCGHFCLCVECGEAFSECPVCFKKILADVITYLS